MTTVKSAALALTAALCAAALAGAAEAKGPEGGGGFAGGHAGSMAPMGHTAGNIGHGPSHMGSSHMRSSHVSHVTHGDDHHHHHHHGYFPVYGFGIGDGYYYDDYSYGDDCYRVYRHHRWRVVCDD